MSGYKSAQNPWTKNVQRANDKKVEERFIQERKKLQEAVKKHAKDYESSEEEDELESNNVIDTVFKHYEVSDTKSELIGRTKEYLENAFVSGAITCLICISSVKRNDSIWSCVKCYGVFHLMCIQRWSKDTLIQQKQALEEYQNSKIQLKWGCPKCRCEYGPQDIPNGYFCFCKKKENPTFQPLIVPHSCGEKCGKILEPYCGHECLLLCHPGPCPPCPKMVKVKCFCNSGEEKFQRCCNKEWSCHSICNKVLSCGKHKCGQLCHPGECPACPKKSMQKCLCGGSVKMRDCATPIWQCEKVCGKALECGFHNCEEICHSSECGVCLLSKARNCPCGKSTYELPCTEETPTCGDTCNKILECGMHVCNQRCHKGKCEMCLETITKSCRCGLHMKEVQCRKPYFCETKCKQMKDCYKHPCNRKCCDGCCPPCEKPCGRTLPCRKHTCSSVCHRGPCYPCNLTEKVFCRCGTTFITVPCGKKSRTKPPKCLKLCNIAPECHHEAREPHYCHFGDCPPCRQKCNIPYKTCSHLCKNSCHSAVLVKVQGQKASTPWEEKGPQVTKKAIPCPNCVVPMPVTCLGGHETCDWPCHLARPSSCHKPCGRLLQCGNHNCTKECHIVEGGTDDFKAGTNCEHCERGCSKPRPVGCTHTCPKPCHDSVCPPCKQMIRSICHCGLTQLYTECDKLAKATDKEEILSCGDQCPKNYPCGHRCKSKCHSGECPNPEQCKKKIKICCKCKRIKKEFSCETNRKGEAIIPCDDICLQQLSIQKQQNDKLQAQKREEEEKRNKEELEKFNKMFKGKKKHRERKVKEEDNGNSLIKMYFLLILGFIVCAAGVYLSVR